MEWKLVYVRKKSYDAPLFTLKPPCIGCNSTKFEIAFGIYAAFASLILEIVSSFVPHISDASKSLTSLM